MTHDKASWTSPVVTALVEGGATCIGKTVVDELAYGYLPSGPSGYYKYLNGLLNIFLGVQFGANKDIPIYSVSSLFLFSLHYVFGKTKERKRN